MATKKKSKTKQVKKCYVEVDKIDWGESIELLLLCIPMMIMLMIPILNIFILQDFQKCSNCDKDNNFWPRKKVKHEVICK